MAWPATIADGSALLLLLFADRRVRPAALTELAARVNAVVTYAPAGGRDALSLGDARCVASWIATHALELDARPDRLTIGALGARAALRTATAAVERVRADGLPAVRGPVRFALGGDSIFPSTHPSTIHPSQKETPMRKIVAGLFVTLDGVTDHPEQWQSRYMDAEIGQALGAAMSTAGTLVLGRRTYEEWAAYWPQAGPDNSFAGPINALPKLVATSATDELEWANSTRIEGDVPQALTALKDQDGGDLLINGSATLVRSLIAAGVLAELQLLVHPVIAGGARRLFDGLQPTRMDLAEAKPFGNGVVSLTYRPVGADR